MDKHILLTTLFLAFELCFCESDKPFKSKLQGQSISETGGTHIGRERSKRFVQLEPGQENVVYQQCTLPNGKAGRCHHLHHCILDEFKNDFLKYTDYLCIINGTSVGTCCPEEKLAQMAGGLAGDLPQTALESEEADTLLRTGEAQNRGCGISTAARNRLVGARPANPREWPWIAAVMADGREQYCGGALITDRHVLTAAHCTRRWKAEDMKVRLGEYDFNRRNDTRSYDFQVVEIRQHVDFQLPTYLHDISILKLHRPATFNTYVWPICLPPVGRDFTNQSLTVIGWGTQFYGGPTSEVLMEVSVPMWPHNKCEDSFTDPIYDTVVCAGGWNGGADSCQGDSGGPLMYQMESGRWAVVGIVSWGIKCGEPGHPGVYTNVQRYLRWIVENTRF